MAVPFAEVIPLQVNAALALHTASSPEAETRDREAVILEAWRIVDREYYDPKLIDSRQMATGAIRGMLATLDDPHTTIADPERARQQRDDIRGVFDGIGISVEIKESRLVVNRVIDDSPALGAGIIRNDVIARIDDIDVRGMTLNEVTARLRGARGTKVILTILRTGVTQTLVLEVTRGEVRTASVRSRMLGEGVGYIQVSSFAETVGRDSPVTLKNLTGAGATGLIVDLRNNPGGLLESAVDVVSQFLDDGVVVYEQRRDKEMTPFYVRHNGSDPVIHLPMAILINKGSASSAEIVAGALQDRRRGILIGEATYGKNSIQNLHQLTDNSSLRVTFAKWLSPARQVIAGKGLTPDVFIPITDDDRRLNRDPQLDRAVDYLRTRIARAD